MKKLIAIGLGLALGATACNKPKEEDCRRALENIRRLSHTDKIDTIDMEGWVRRCRGNSKRETVQCAIGAQTVEQLKACNIPVEAPPSGSGSASAGSGSAGSGSASGSAGSGSASGSGSGS